MEYYCYICGMRVDEKYLAGGDRGYACHDCIEEREKDDLTDVKDYKGKLQMSLMLSEINKSVVEVREYANSKYKDAKSWAKVDKVMWKDAMLRHLMAYIEDENSTDEESGLRHIDHVACNLAYILENMKGGK